MPFAKVEDAIKDFREGKMLVLVDAEDRENEGDIIFAARHSNPEKINFILSHARGVICTPISQEIAKKFDLELMVKSNTSNHETPFTITVDAKDALTGVSTVERDMTIKIFADKNATKLDFVKPGHINPLIAKDGGVLERTGHTEGTVDMCRLAGLESAGVLCEILNDDGSMARRDDLELFCKKYDLKMITIEQIINYRLKTESLVSIINEEKSTLANKPCIKYTIKDYKDNEHIVFKFKNPDKVANVKFYSSVSDFDLLSKLEDTLNIIEKLNDEGGFLVFLKNRQKDEKNYGIGAQVLKSVGAKDIKLLSDSDQKNFVALAGFGINIVWFHSV